MKTIKREKYLNELISVKGTPDIKVITGIRRSGKSKLLESFIDYLKENDKKANLIYIDFNSLENEDLQDYHALHTYVLDKYLKSKNNYLFIDEIQNCNGFEKAINSLHSKEIFDIYITGSNAFLLSSDLATLFTGRTYSIEVFPFSFNEYLQYYKYKDKYKAFDLYLNEGGMSGSYIHKDIKDKYKYIREVYDTLVLRDIVQKHRIKKTELFEKVSDYMIDNVSAQLSSRNIEKELKNNNDNTNHSTIDKYIKYLCNSFGFYKIRRYNLKGLKYLTTNEKYYLADYAFRYALHGTKNPDYGKALENIVAIELLRRGYQVYTGALYQKEIDFVAQKQSEKIYIQVSYNVSNKETLKRELDLLLSIRDNYPKVLISRTYEPKHDINGIEIIDITDWLTND